jgi:inner membrane protein
VLSALHFLTHIGLSWIVANLVSGSRRDRYLVVLAGVVLDLDGIGILWSQHAYVVMHRAAGHGLLCALLVIAGTMLLADSPLKTGVLAAISFHLHLVLDVVGTGGLPIRYFWPFADWSWTYRDHWVLASWQNGVVMAATLLGVIWIAWRKRRTPGEILVARAPR